MRIAGLRGSPAGLKTEFLPSGHALYFHKLKRDWGFRVRHLSFDYFSPFPAPHSPPLRY